MEHCREVLLHLFIGLLLFQCEAGACNGSFPLLPFGVDEGDTMLVGYIAASPAITLCPPFPLFGKNETIAYVITSGYLSFNNHRIANLYFPQSTSVVAPLWVDIDVRNFGAIQYRLTMAKNQCIQDIVEQTFLISDFSSTRVLVATYSEVVQEAQQDNNKINSFQVILVTNGQLSFALFSYGDIQWGSNGFAGFSSASMSFELPGSLSPTIVDVESSSNVGVPGLYVYRVDQQNILEPVSNYTIGNLQVLVTTSKPLPVLLGDRITLTCSVNNSLPTSHTYIWSRSGTNLRNETTPTLVIAGVLTHNLGLYECSARNGQTKGSATLLLYTVPPALQKGSNEVKLSSDCDHSEPTRDDITTDVVQLLSSEFGFQPLGRVKAFPAASCEEISHTHSQLGPGLYWIADDGQDPRQQYCTI